MTRVYASLPLSGPLRAAGRDLLRGAELALDRAPGVELVALDSFDEEDREARAAENAVRAAEDSRALAYLGDFHSSQVWATAPLLSQAGLLQVAPVATFAELEGSTLVRLMPPDGVGARAIAGWLADHGVRRLLVVHDHDDGYGVPVGAMCADAARERGLAVTARPIWDHDEPMELDGAEALLYVGVAGSGAVGLWHDLHAANPAMWLLGSEGIAEPWLAGELSDAEGERTRFFVAQRAPFGFYGFEAMALILDAIAAGGDRATAVAAARSTRDRDSVLGRYSIDADGHTTSTAYGRYTVAGGELIWDRDGPTR
jgi:branched-chain amino acid transport system substrate-binding protein